MASQGPLNPTTASQSGTGAVWSTPTSIEGTSTFATASVTAGNAVNSEVLLGTVFGFSIPGGATIQGITFTFTRKAPNASLFSCVTNGIEIYKAGSPVGGQSPSGANWTTGAATETYGSSSNLWGTTWTPSQINNSGFGVSVKVSLDYSAGSVGTRTADIQNYLVTVTYVLGGKTFSQASIMGL